MFTRKNVIALTAFAVTAGVFAVGAVEGGNLYNQQIDSVSAEHQKASAARIQLLQNHSKLQQQLDSANSSEAFVTEAYTTLANANSAGFIDAEKLAEVKKTVSTVKQGESITPISKVTLPEIETGFNLISSTRKQTEAIAKANRQLLEENKKSASTVQSATADAKSVMVAADDAVNSVVGTSEQAVITNSEADEKTRTAFTEAAKNVSTTFDSKKNFTQAVEAYYTAGTAMVASQNSYVKAQEAAAASKAKSTAVTTQKVHSTSASVPASAPAPAVTPAPATQNKHYNVYVRTTISSVDANGELNPALQSTIDAGGQVAVYYAAAGVTDISAHNYVDSTALKLQNGDTVTFTGAFTGTYKVTGSIYVTKGTDEYALNRLGTSVAMQTCEYVNNQMRLVGLSAI